ncbi:T9SS type A sorting domain-containing protein [Flavobacterium antarcticum]|uniref:T9SS type A sorting domain-containing protein n=1 Tax=Flavobacterium antarcticum TaxID=271155 RepID=UPI0004084821|nr:T9SS type A sorting domain-containing protein [Flavobacterium antarcticum]
MKKTLLLFLLLFGLQARSQTMQILSTEATTVEGGINVNLQTITGHGAGFISNSYTVTGNVIDLSVCYWFDFTLPILEFTHDFFIPVSEVGEYTINIHIMMSQSIAVCDNYANPANTSLQYNFMSVNTNLNNETLKIYPNPTAGILYFYGLNAKENRVSVYDISGKQIVIPHTFVGEKLDLSALQNGIYFLKIDSEKGSIQRKIILKK